MRIQFNIHYYTVWGQTLHIVGSCPALGNSEEVMAPQMSYVSNGCWQYEIELPDDVGELTYRYFLRTEAGVLCREWVRGHVLTVVEGVSFYQAYDFWLNTPKDLPFYSSAFTKSLFAHHEPSAKWIKYDRSVLISVFAPYVERGKYLALAGGQEVLGNWNPEFSLKMYSRGHALWTAVLNADKLQFPLVYKFVIKDEANLSYCLWEEGENRCLELPSKGDAAHVSGLFFRYPANRRLWKGAGTVIPVFSLRSERSYGVGDLGDLFLLTDWAKATGQCLIQVLPMNDTRMTQTWIDSYPYSAMSIYALHPMYINLDRLGTLEDVDRRRFYEESRCVLNAKETVDYVEVVRVKMAYCREFVEQEGIQTLTANDEFRRFFEKNKFWLVPYAAYCYLRDRYNTADFSEWEHFSVFDSAEISRLTASDSAGYPEILFSYYLQFVLDKQFREVTQYARSKGVVLKGDLPIGVNRHSVEVWTEPNYFNLNGQSGAPPDDFSVLGQNWLFPTYRWENMRKDGYGWWKKRFAKMNDFFDCFRVDHILGFFRIWEIPEDYVQGLCGHFNPSLPLSADEIERAGLHFDEKRFISPRIDRQYLPELFGDDADEVRETFLAQSSSHHFVLKPFCDTQRKIEYLFSGKTDEKSFRIQQGLYAIANEVLFLKDPERKELYHPRISASQSFLYRELNPEEKRAFDILYEDYFYHRHNAFWKEQALKKLIPLMDSTEMLVCAEDLGMIPASVPEVMEQLQLLSLEIERMPKAFGIEFAELASLPYRSVCTTSTHDMSPLRSWWKEDRAKTQRYYNMVLKRGGEAPEECTGELAEQILFNHLNAPSMLAIIPLQDWLAIDDALKRTDERAERINVPAQTNHYWCYRMHLTLEELIQAKVFNTKIRNLINHSTRNQE